MGPEVAFGDRVGVGVRAGVGAAAVVVGVGDSSGVAVAVGVGVRVAAGGGLGLAVGVGAGAAVVDRGAAEDVERDVDGVAPAAVVAPLPLLHVGRFPHADSNSPAARAAAPAAPRRVRVIGPPWSWPPGPHDTT